MKRRHARGHGSERLRVSLAINAEDRARAISHVERPIGRERQPTCDAEIAREWHRGSVRRHALDRSLEAARDVQPALRIDGHRRRIHDAGRERFTRAVWTHAENRDRDFLPAGAAERHIEVALAIEYRVIDLVQPGREGRGDPDVRGLARHALDADRGPTAGRELGYDDADGARRGINNARAFAA